MKTLKLLNKEVDKSQNRIDIEKFSGVKNNISISCVLNAVGYTDKDKFKELLIWAIHDGIIDKVGGFYLIDYDTDSSGWDDEAAGCVTQDDLSPYCKDMIALLIKEYKDKEFSDSAKYALDKNSQLFDIEFVVDIDVKVVRKVNTYVPLPCPLPVVTVNVCRK